MAAVTASLFLTGALAPVEGAPPAGAEEARAQTPAEAVEWEPPPASMAAPERARAWWLRAQALEGARRFRESANAYRRSYEAMPTLAALYNMALAHDYARQPLDAISAYRRYAAQAEVDAAERAQVLDRITEIEGDVARIVVALPEDFGAGVVMIDGVEVTLATEGNLVLPGPHDVAINDDEGRTSQQRVVVVAGTRVVVRFDDAFNGETVEDAPQNPTVDMNPPLMSPREARRSRALRRGMWFAVGLTAASGVSLLGVGVATLDAKRTFEASLCDGPCPEGVSYDADAASRFYQLRTASNTLVGITAASALVLTVLAIMGADRRNKVQGDERGGRSTPTAARWRLRPTVGGLQLDF